MTAGLVSSQFLLYGAIKDALYVDVPSSAPFSSSALSPSDFVLPPAPEQHILFPLAPFGSRSNTIHCSTTSRASPLAAERAR